MEGLMWMLKRGRLEKALHGARVWEAEGEVVKTVAVILERKNSNR